MQINKKNIVAAMAGGLVFASAFAATLAYADQGFSRWTSTIPDGISFSVGQGGRTHPLHVFRDQAGNLVHGTQNQLESGNWSGYVVANYETGKTYTSAAGAWTVASAAVPPGQTAGYASSWVGIGGFCENANCTRGDGSLIQLGTDSDVSGSRTNYYAWYEMLPQSETLITGFAVHPGDHITASLALVPSSESPSRFGRIFQQQQTWKLTITDVTTGATWTKNVNYQSSELSADWIEEAPSSYSGILPLANFGTATFDPETVNGGNPLFTAANEVIMLDPKGQTSNPSAPDKDTDGFNACWGNGTTLTACTAPTS